MRTLATFFLLAFFTSLFHPMQVSARAERQNPSETALYDSSAPLIRWSQTAEANGVAYFLIPAEKSLQRYSLTTRAWLAPITFSQTPAVFAVDDSGIYVAFGQALYRFNLDGANQYPFSACCSSPVYNLLVYPEYLIAFMISTPSVSLNKETGTVVDMLIPDKALGVVHMLPEKALMVGLSNSTELDSIQLNPHGMFGDQFFRSSSDISWSKETFSLPGQNRVVTDAGQIFFANDLNYVRSITDRIDAVAVYGHQYVVARKGALIGYNANDQKLGEYTPLQPAQAIFVSGSTIFSFFSRPDGIDVTPLPVSVVKLTGQKEPIHPAQLDFWPDAVALGSDETLYLLHRPSLSIFRWSVAQRKFLSPIVLSDPPQNMAYAPLTNRLYLAYPNGTMTQIPLDTSLQEQPFTTTRSHLNGYKLVACDDFVLGVSNAYMDFFQYVYNAQGAQVAVKDAQVDLFNYVWSSANHRFYYLQREYSPHLVVSEEIGSAGQIQNELKNDVRSEQPYLWVKPDGLVLLTGDGKQYDAQTLTLNPGGTYPAPVTGAAWSGGSLFTVTPETGGAGLKLGKYNLAFQPVSTTHLEGSEAQLFAVSEGLLAVTRQGEHTSITIYGNDLQAAYQTTNYYVNLPIVAAPSPYQTQYVDDFSNPASGWAIYEDDSVKFGYVNGAYAIRTKQPGLYAAFAPTPRSENYEMEVDLSDINPSDEYGVILDVIGNADRFITFGFSKWSNRMFAHVFDGITDRMVYENNIYTSKIRIKVVRTQYELRVEDGNGSAYPLMGGISFDLYPYVSRVGFYVMPRPDQPNAEARFDNFVFRPLEGSITPAYQPLAPLNAQSGSLRAGDMLILPSSVTDLNSIR